MKDKLKLCFNKTELVEYLQNKSIHHKCYKVYANDHKIEYWLEKKPGLYLGNGSKWNDTEDARDFQYNKEKINFGLCFSFSISENIAMWMLYGGKGKDGMMINFSGTNMKDICKAESIELGYFDNNEFVVVKTLKNDYEIYLMDVLYCSEEDDAYYTIKRSDERHKVDETLILSSEIIKKAYPWSYENECRLIVSIPKRCIRNKKITDVRIPLPESVVSAVKRRTYHAPNYEGEIKYEKSKLTGKVKWDLDR